jgi:hypothetical protein
MLDEDDSDRQTVFPSDISSLEDLNELFRIGESDFFKKSVADYIGSLGAAISLHTGDPGTTGANLLAGFARQATRWATAVIPTTGPEIGMAVITGDKVFFTNVPASTSITHYGVWTATTGGTFLYGRPLNPTALFTVPGNIELVPTHAFGLT